MSDERERKVRERAHAIWEREGRPDGRDQEHWERASHEIETEERTPGGQPTDRSSGLGGEKDAPRRQTKPASNIDARQTDAGNPPDKSRA